MTDSAPPEDLVALKTAWYAARDHVHRVSGEQPAGQELTVPGFGRDAQPRPIRLFSDEQSARLAAARSEEMRLAVELSRHPWRQAQPDRHKAERTVNDLAYTRWAGATS